MEDCAVVAEERPVRPRRSPYRYFERRLTLVSIQDLLADHISEFFVRFSDPLPTKRARLRILVALANESNVQVLLKELMVRRIATRRWTTPSDEFYLSQIYVKDVEDDFSAAAIAAIGTCAQRVPSIAGECLKTLIKLSQSKNGAF